MSFLSPVKLSCRSLLSRGSRFLLSPSLVGEGGAQRRVRRRAVIRNHLSVIRLDNRFPLITDARILTSIIPLTRPSGTLSHKGRGKKKAFFRKLCLTGILGVTLLTPHITKAQGFDTLLQKLTGSKVEKEISGSSADQVASETADPFKPLPSAPLPSSAEILSTQQEAQDFTPPENIKTNGVVVQGLDKITGRVFITKAPLNQEIGFGPLRIVVHTCEKAPAESRDESAAFVTISEIKEPFPAQELFSGWMFSSSPALSSFDHPLYDVWVKECKILTKGR